MFKKILAVAMTAGAMIGASAEEPIITFKTSIYETFGPTNSFSIILGATAEGTVEVDCGFGYTDLYDLIPASYNEETEALDGTYITCRVSEEGIVKIYGDPSIIDVINFTGCYIQEIDFSQCTNLEILKLEHNELKSLDLSNFSNLTALYLSDNTFTPETPLKIGGNKPNLQILEIDIVDYLDQSFNLSDYPSLLVFDGYCSRQLYNVDPTGCPNLMSLSVDLAPVSSLDVSKNPNLISLNISDSRITSIDITNNPALQTFLAQQGSGTVNVGYSLSEIDLTNNPNLVILNLAGNELTSVDLSSQVYVTNLNLARNKLTSVDLTNCTNLYSVNVSKNLMSFATLPYPIQTWGEYFYVFDPVEVDRCYKVGDVLDLSDQVLREETTTTCTLYSRSNLESSEVELTEGVDYSYADGKITFLKENTDSIYAVYANSFLDEYTMSTTKFMVKTAEEYGKPSLVAQFTSSSTSSHQAHIKLGLADATDDNLKELLIAIGDNDAQSYSVSSSTAIDLDLSGKQTVSIYTKEGDMLTTLVITETPLSSVNLSNATDLKYLQINNCKLSAIDLLTCRMLETLDLDNNNLSALDLLGPAGDFEKYRLRTLHAANNKLSSFSFANGLSWIDVDLSNNRFSELSFKNCDNIEYLDLHNNLLADALSLTYQENAKVIDISGNRITSLTLPDEMASLESFNAKNNYLGIGAIPEVFATSDIYTYAPQRKITIPTKAPSVNISEQNLVINGQSTVFTWYFADGTQLTDEQVTCNAGATTFNSSLVGNSVYCKMTHPALPQFDGSNALTTSTMEIASSPNVYVGSFTTTTNSSDVELIITSNKDADVLYIDWRGDGSEFTEYSISTERSIFTEQTSYAGASAKMYSFGSPNDIKVFTLNAPISAVDFSLLNNADCLSIYGGGATAENIALPTSGDVLFELTLSGNDLSAGIDLSKYTNLVSLNINNCNLESFDFSPFKKLQITSANYNEITSLTFDNKQLWGLSLGSNQLSEIDLSGAPNVQQLGLWGNQFYEINLDAVKNSLVALDISDNFFKFSTLPLQGDFPNMVNVYYYGNQAKIDISKHNNTSTVDLSSEVAVGDSISVFTWYMGEPLFDTDSGELVDGIELLEGDEYTIENGVTTFYVDYYDVCAVITNPEFPDTYLQTTLIDVCDASGIENVRIDATSAEWYTLNGIHLSDKPTTAGIYICRQGSKTSKVLIK